MKRRMGRVMGGKNAWIAPQILKSKHKKLRSAGISKEGCHDFALNGVHIVLHDF
jgi:hypothetical protein